VSFKDASYAGVQVQLASGRDAVCPGDGATPFGGFIPTTILAIGNRQTPQNYLAWLGSTSRPFRARRPLRVELFFCCIGTFSVNNNLDDIFITAVFGFIGRQPR